MNIPKTIWLYRITHINNLRYILEHGIYTRESEQFDPNYISIGDSSLINYRKNLIACDPPGGKLSEFVPFYFGPRSPMLYQIALGYEDIEKHPQENIVYIITSVDQIKQHKLSYFFTDGNARSETTSFFTYDNDFANIDWVAVYSTYWKSDETDLLRKQKKQSEFLIKEYVPVSCFDYIGVYNDNARQKVLDLLVDLEITLPIKVSPHKLYYDNL